MDLIKTFTTDEIFEFIDRQSRSLEHDFEVNQQRFEEGKISRARYLAIRNFISGRRYELWTITSHVGENVRI